MWALQQADATTRAKRSRDHRADTHICRPAEAGLQVRHRREKLGSRTQPALRRRRRHCCNQSARYSANQRAGGKSDSHFIQRRRSVDSIAGGPQFRSSLLLKRSNCLRRLDETSRRFGGQVTSSTTTLRSDRSHDADVSQCASIEGPPNKLSSWSAAMTQGVFKKTGYRNARKSEQRYDRAQHRARRRRLFVSRRAAGGRKGPARWRAVASRTEGLRTGRSRRTWSSICPQARQQ